MHSIGRSGSSGRCTRGDGSGGTVVAAIVVTNIGNGDDDVIVSC